MEDDVWQAAEIDGRIYRARDDETGAIMELRSTPEIDVRRVVVCLPGKYLPGKYLLGKSKFNFTLSFRQKNLDHLAADQDNCNIKLYVGDFQSLIRKRYRTFERNTDFVRYLKLASEREDHCHRRQPV